MGKMIDHQHAPHVVVNYDDHTVRMDGEYFPWFISADAEADMVVDEGGEYTVPSLRLTILAESLKIIGEPA